MIAKLRLVFSITILFLSFYGAAQSSYWKDNDLKGSLKQAALNRFNIKEAKAFTLDETLFKQGLQKTAALKNSRNTVFFPDEKGVLIPFEIVEAQLFSEQLAKKYPSIKSYKGVGVKNKEVRIRFSVSHKGIQSMITSPGKEGALFMQKSEGNYILYSGKDHLSKDIDFVCKTTSKVSEQQASITAKLVDDQALRKFRIAVAASGEYTVFHGGTKIDALAAINATLTRVNGVFEQDLGVTLELIANTDDVIYLDPETDPFTGSLSSQAQNNFTSVIGEANYDIGHLFNQEDNSLDGNAGFIGSVCSDNRKGSGYTTFDSPEGDTYDIDLVAHEIGHQFGANHSFSYQSEGTTVQVEPASGTTIMAYAGITGINNVASNSDDYFHYVSIVQIREYLETVSCGETVVLTNAPPTLTPVQDYIIPKGTAFVLTGDAVDTDVGDVLTYTWEQIDNGVVTRTTFGPTNPSGATFRSLPPTTLPERYFPRLDRILSGNLTQTAPSIGEEWETVSTVERDLNFSLTVRDNALGGGQVVSDEVTVSVINGAGPFMMTSQTQTTSLVAGEVQTITWDVADTNLAPVSAATVDIFLSTDGGLTYPELLAENVPNNGSHAVVIPAFPTPTARIMIKASDNIFFAVNSTDFTITDSEIVLNFSELEYEICKPDDELTVTFNYETYLGFAEESTFSIVNLPTGLNAVFSPLTATATDTPVILTLSGITNLAVGLYPIQVLATSATVTKEVTLQLSVYDTSFTDVVLTSPVDGLQDTSKAILLEWEDNIQNTAYDVEIATDAAFTNIIESTTVPVNSYPPDALENDTEYFWRVKPKNSCDEGVFSTVGSFRTIQFNCKITEAFGLPLAISASGTPTITSKIAFYEDLPLADINVNLDIEHSFLADLVISLTSPTGTVVVLTSNSCGDSSDINATFDDDAMAFNCFGTPAINGLVKPLGSLSSFNGESILGEWILEIQDNAASDGGSLNAFSLEICVEGDFRPDDDLDGVFDDGDDLCLGTPVGQEVDASGCPIYRFSNENFNISLESESCRSNNDGQIQISPKVVLNYDVDVIGPGVDVTQDFTDSYSLTDLSAGTYSLCITGTDGVIVYEPYCFEVVISEPELLSVSSKASLDGKQLTVSMQGADLYNLELNGQLLQTAASEITLDLTDGINFLKVYTNLSCQGVYEDEFLTTNELVIFPNPVSDVATLFFGNNEGEVAIRIFSADGRFVKNETKMVVGTEIQLDLSSLPTGIYYLQYIGNTIKGMAKVIKR